MAPGAAAGSPCVASLAAIRSAPADSIRFRLPLPPPLAVMDKRFFLAILLTGVILLITPVLFPVARPTPAAPTAVTGAANGSNASNASSATAPTGTTASAGPTAATTGLTTATPASTDSVVRPPIRTIRLANTIAR